MTSSTLVEEMDGEFSVDLSVWLHCGDELRLSGDELRLSGSEFVVVWAPAGEEPYRLGRPLWS